LRPEPPQDHPKQFFGSSKSRLRMSLPQDRKLLSQSQIFQKQIAAGADRSNEQDEKEPQRARHELFVSRTSSLQGESAVGFAAMMYAANFDGIGGRTYEEEPVIANAQPNLFHPLESLHVARARFRKAMQGGENVHGDRLA
jgi:hypothetical protein